MKSYSILARIPRADVSPVAPWERPQNGMSRKHMSTTYKAALNETGLTKQDMKKIVNAYKDRMESEKTGKDVAQAHQKFTQVCGTMVEKISQRQIEAGIVGEVTMEQKIDALQDFMKHSGSDLYYAVASAKNRTKSFVWAGVGAAVGLLLGAGLGFIDRMTGGAHPPAVAWGISALYTVLGAGAGKGLSRGGIGASRTMHENRLKVAYGLRAAVRDASDEPAEAKS